MASTSRTSSGTTGCTSPIRNSPQKSHGLEACISNRRTTIPLLPSKVRPQQPMRNRGKQDTIDSRTHLRSEALSCGKALSEDRRYVHTERRRYAPHDRPDPNTSNTSECANRTHTHRRHRLRTSDPRRSYRRNRRGTRLRRGSIATFKDPYRERAPHQLPEQGTIIERAH